MNESDEGQVLEAGIALAKQCASAMMMGEPNVMYDLLDAVEDEEVLHTAFIYAVTQWSHSMEVFLEEGEWTRWLLSKESQT